MTQSVSHVSEKSNEPLLLFSPHQLLAILLAGTVLLAAHLVPLVNTFFCRGMIFTRHGPDHLIEKSPEQIPQALRLLYFLPVRVNSASSEELMTLPGIGTSLAERIIVSRKQDGPFASLDDLTRVYGIGPRKLALIRSHITL